MKSLSLRILVVTLIITAFLPLSMIFVNKSATLGHSSAGFGLHADCPDDVTFDDREDAMRLYWATIYENLNAIFELQGTETGNPDPAVNTDLAAAIAPHQEAMATNSQAYIQIIRDYGVSEELLATIEIDNASFLSAAQKYATVFNVNNTGGDGGDEGDAANKLYRAGKTLASDFERISSCYLVNSSFEGLMVGLSVTLTQLAQAYRISYSGLPPAEESYSLVQSYTESIADLLNAAANNAACSPEC